MGTIGFTAYDKEHPEHNIIISPDNIITIGNKLYSDIATRLAKAYEDSGETEFTIKKDYQEIESAGSYLQKR